MNQFSISPVCLCLFNHICYVVCTLAFLCSRRFTFACRLLMYCIFVHLSRECSVLRVVCSVLFDFAILVQDHSIYHIVRHLIPKRNNQYAIMTPSYPTASILELIIFTQYNYTAVSLKMTHLNSDTNSSNTLKS